jgi:hypothetical protein
MKKRGNLLLFMITLAAIGLMGYASLSNAAHTGGSVPLKDAAGLDITVGSTTPYSPKQTCGVCHNYESDTAVAVKNHGTGQATYEVPYPQHGVTAGYHFQQGRNLNWNDAQREFFHQANFTSSGGMYGKY